ncbi:ATP-binding protein [Bacillus sp. JJ722]|uniref:ATP-binding protein n=1 Tax=Bacillus sp. JJ722 TaxID=3122973 RepID=UPI003000D867
MHNKESQVNRMNEAESIPYETFFYRSRDALIITNTDLKVIKINERAKQVLQRSMDACIGTSIRDFLKLVPDEVFQYQMALLKNKGIYIDEWLMNDDLGNSIHVEFEAIFNKSYYLFVIREIASNQKNERDYDFTDKRLIEIQLKESKEIFAYIFEQAIDAIVLLNDDGIILEANDVACRIFELEKELLVGSQIEDFIMKKDKKFYQVNARFQQNGEIREELFYLMPNGQRKLLEFTSKKMDGTNKIITIFRNVSERYEMEVKLRKSERRFRTIFDGMSDGLILWKNNEIFDVNQAGAKVLKLSKKRIKTMSLEELFRYIPQKDKGLEKMLQKLEKQNNVEDILSFTNFDGKMMHLEFSTKKNLVSGLHLTVFKVVTEKLELQEQLRKSDTLSVVGELAAGIAHEIRNPMTALKGFIQLLQSSIQEDFSNYFEIITSELKRIDLIITEFLILAKPQAVQYEEQDINTIVQETITLLSAESMLYNIVFEKQLYEKPLLLYCEANQLKQVFINIVKNAIESMRSGGCITISTVLHNEKMVKITISDEGCGISEEKVKRLGEPFYTTKDRGTGLGLMVSYKIIEEHNGWIEVESLVGKGTTFSIFLPCYLDTDYEEEI